MTTVRVFAPAKINLTLHVTGQRGDGYHELDSLVSFAPVGDWLTLGPGTVSSIAVDGPEAAGVPADLSNLALRAALLTLPGQEIAMSLTKNLPAASGIGGGSADAAAAIRGALLLEDPDTTALMTLGTTILKDTRLRAPLCLGADVPMCLLPRPLRARGIGDRLDHTQLPQLPAVLVNPRVAVSTPAVFKALEQRNNPPMPDPPPKFAEASALIDWLRQQRNDLEAPAKTISPTIGKVLTALAKTEGCALARMSGSGATCFGLFDALPSAMQAVTQLKMQNPSWWIHSAVLGDQTKLAMPTIVPT